MEFCYYFYLCFQRTHWLLSYVFCSYFWIDQKVSLRKYSCHAGYVLQNSSLYIFDIWSHTYNVDSELIHLFRVDKNFKDQFIINFLQKMTKVNKEKTRHVNLFKQRITVISWFKRQFSVFLLLLLFKIWYLTE
jgi:hypothetical protein